MNDVIPTGIGKGPFTYATLKTTGEWVAFVHLLGRILAMDHNAHGVDEMRNACVNGYPADHLAACMGHYIRATNKQKEEAAAMVGLTALEEEEAFERRRQARRAAVAPPQTETISHAEWERRQAMPAVNNSQPLSEVKAGDIVEVIPDRPFCTAGKELVKAVTEDEIILENGSHWDRKTGDPKQPPWAYHL